MQYSTSNPYQRMENHNGDSGNPIGLICSFALTTLFGWYNEHHKLLSIWLDWETIGATVRAIVFPAIGLVVTFFGNRWLNKKFPKNKSK